MSACPRLPRAAVVFLCLSWIVVVLYPEPHALLISVRNLVWPPVDVAAVEGLVPLLPDDPRAIERYVLETAVPYASDWETAGVPWSFPSTSEVLAAGRGDCESRAVLLATLLTARDVPNQLRMSFDHIWVEYPGKAPNAAENDARALVRRGADGWYGLHWPEGLDLGDELRSQAAIYWTPMPEGRRVALFVGVALVASWNGLAYAVATLPRRRGRRRAVVLRRTGSGGGVAWADEPVAVDQPDGGHRQDDERREHGQSEHEERPDGHPHRDLDHVHLSPLSRAWPSSPVSGRTCSGAIPTGYA